MSEFRLQPTSFLSATRIDIGGSVLEEIDPKAIAALAVPNGGQSRFADAIQNELGIELPTPRLARQHDEDGWIINSAPSQYLIWWHGRCSPANAHISKSALSAAYVTEQSDNWVILRLSGSLADAALERLCPIDLHPATFPVGAVARTHMEHMGSFLLREGNSKFLLISASSSAQSFLHAVETSLDNVS